MGGKVTLRQMLQYRKVLAIKTKINVIFCIIVLVFSNTSRQLSKNVKLRIYNTIILPVVLYGRETWSLTVREEHKLRVFENRVLRRIFGPK
jgi:hypothetical protein